METLYTGHIHGFTSSQNNISYGSVGTAWGSQGGLVALGVVLGSSVSLVGLAFAFITYSLFSDLRSLAGTTLLSLLASLFMGQLLFVIGVGGIQDQELCLSLSLALLYMKLASLCWLCCCCHQTLVMFRSNVNLLSTPEQKMGRRLAHYSILSWGFPFAMVAVAAAFKYKEKVWRVTGTQVLAQLVQEVAASTHCWLMEGPAFIWGFLIPAVVLLCLGGWLAAQGSGAAKISAGLQVDAKARNKIMKKRGLQIGLFIRLLLLITVIVLLGGLASIWNTPELWAIYSIGQGIQGIVTAMLVTCNCRILKLYTSSRGSKNRKGKYKSLRDCEGGRYGVLSVTNPNYYDEQNTDDVQTTTKSNQSVESSHEDDDDDDDDEIIIDAQKISSKLAKADGTSFVRMGYKEDIFVERNDHKDNGSHHQQQIPITVGMNGELSGCLAIDEIKKKPPIESV